MKMKEEITRCEKCDYIIRKDYIMGPMRKGTIYRCICEEDESIDIIIKRRFGNE